MVMQIRNQFGKPGVGASGPSGWLQEPGGIFYDIGSGTGKPVSSGPGAQQPVMKRRGPCSTGFEMSA